MRKYSDVCQRGWNTMISRLNFHMCMRITFGNYDIDNSLIWTIQFLIGVRSIEEHLSFPYLFGLRETSKQEWTNSIAE